MAIYIYFFFTSYVGTLFTPRSFVLFQRDLMHYRDRLDLITGSLARDWCLTFAQKLVRGNICAEASSSRREVSCGRRCESIKRQKRPGRILPCANRIILNFTKYVDISENMGVGNSEGVFFNNVRDPLFSSGKSRAGDFPM